MSEVKKKLQELEDRHVVKELKLLKYINDNTKQGIEPVLECYVKENMLKVWNSIADDAKDKSMDTLVEILWNEMCKSSGFKYDIDKTDQGIQIKCTYCPFVDLAKKADSLEMGYNYYCASDPYIVEGFNPKIGFKRTKTLMEGDDCCDHFYYLK